MLGRFSNGMTVRIPITFNDSNKNPVQMENVVVGIQFWDKDQNKLEQILNETPMSNSGPGKYLYEFPIPPYAKPGNYVVNVHGKHIGSISNVTDYADTFEIIENKIISENKIPENNATVLQPVKEAAVDKTAEPPAFDINTFKIDQVKRVNQGTKIEIEDVVVDVFNNPVKGVHVNVFEKNGFMPKSPNNVKIASTITDELGVWKMKVSPGEYVFTYKGIGLKELREFRKV